MDKKLAERVLERDQRRCQFPLEHMKSIAWQKCGNPNIHLHHRLFRSQGGLDTEDNLVALCKPHHDWVHDNSEDARLMGLVVKTGDDPDRPIWLDAPIPEDGYMQDEDFAFDD